MNHDCSGEGIFCPALPALSPCTVRVQMDLFPIPLQVPMTMPLVFETASKLWRDRVAGSQEYSVIRNDRMHRAFLPRSPVLESEYRAAVSYRDNLLRMYEGRKLEEVFPGRPVRTPEGEAYCISRRHEIRPPSRETDSTRHALLSDLSLVYGIGKRNERYLKSRGYRTIRDLLCHRRFSAPARECLETLEKGSPRDVLSLVSRWYPPSHLRQIQSARLFDPSDFLFLDIETLGIFQRPIVLVGLASVEGDRLVSDQFLVRDMEEELPAILAAEEYLRKRALLITYNGKAFDIPYLQERCALYGERLPIWCSHLDLLHPARRLFGERFADCRLSTLERGLFGITRNEDIFSMMVPEFYEAYAIHGNPGPLVPVVEHNCQDLVSLARLFFHLLEAA